MNIISNSCVGGYIYRDILHSAYLNPFIWSYIDLPSYINLLIHWNDIDFSNIDIQNTNHVYIDGLVHVHYLHYIKDDSYHLVGFRSSDNTIRFYDIESYIHDKYMSRLNRMRNTSVNMFIIGHSYKYLGQNDLESLMSLKLHNILWIFNDFVVESTNKMIQLYQVNVRNNNKVLASRIMNHINRRISSNV